MSEQPRQETEDTSPRVPAEPESRRLLARRAEALLAGRDRQVLLGREELLELAGGLLAGTDLGEEHLGFAAIMVNNAFWADRFRRVDPSRRLLLLPRCIAGLTRALGGEEEAPLAALVARARELGYTIKVADGTPLAVRLLGEADMDAILGISCLDSLDKAFDKVRLLGIPALAVPLLADGCKETATDLELAGELLESRADPEAGETGYSSLLRRVRELFTPAALEAVLAGGEGEGEGGFEGPEASAAGWIARGGKRFRPFITAAVYQSLVGREELPPQVELAALAVEVFHKASLVHDDIEDHDAFRYGRPTLHRQQGMEIALNVGDYLLGLGYRLIARTGEYVGAQPVLEMLRLLSRTHMGLARGQGMELAWRRSGAGDLTLDGALRIYALKTAPAFEAALGLGMILGGSGAGHRRAIRRYSRYLGVAFQVLNDLEGLAGDRQEGRPTIMPALAALAGEAPAEKGLEERALDLVARCRSRAEAAAAEAGSEALTGLLRNLLAMVLERERSDH